MGNTTGTIGFPISPFGTAAATDSSTSPARPRSAAMRDPDLAHPSELFLYLFASHENPLREPAPLLHVMGRPSAGCPRASRTMEHGSNLPEGGDDASQLQRKRSGSHL